MISVTKDQIAQALARARGNVQRAAAQLGMSRMQMYRRIEQHGLWGELGDIRARARRDYLKGDPS